MTYRTTNEDFNEYLLDDGTVLKLKAVVTEVMKIDGEFDPQGNPLYLVQTQNVIAVDSPDDVRQRSQ